MPTRFTTFTKSSGIYPLTLLYDRACPVCRLEMDGLRDRARPGSLRFVDISAEGFDASPYGVSLDAMREAICAVSADGRLIQGVEVLRLAYAAAGLGWVLRPTAWPGLRQVFDQAYRVFARHRYEVSRVAAPLIEQVEALRARRRLRAMNACHANGCGLPEQES